MSPGERAAELLERAAVAAQRLSAELPAAARAQGAERARRMFVFVILSVLLERRAGRDPAHDALADELKAAFARELLDGRKALKALSKKALPKSDAEKLSSQLDQAGGEDPFAPYYDSFARMRKDSAQGPFDILARALSDEHFEPASRAAAYERLVMTAAALSDELLQGL